MPILKGQLATTAMREAIVLDLGDVSRQARKILDAAQAKADQIIAAAEHEATRQSDDGFSQGKEKGHAQGMQTGLEQGRKEGREEAVKQAKQQFEELTHAWLSNAKQLETERAEMQRLAHHAVLDLSIRMAELVVARVVVTDRNVVVDQVARAVAHLLRPVDATVRVCAEDRPALQEALPALVAEAACLKHVHLVDDIQVQRGGCVLTYGQGRIDATIDTQLQRIVEMLVPDKRPPVSGESDTADDTSDEPPAEQAEAKQDEPDDTQA